MMTSADREYARGQAWTKAQKTKEPSAEEKPTAKEPTYLATRSKVIPGDVLIFREVSLSGSAGVFNVIINQTGKVKGEKKGHADSTHVAIAIAPPTSQWKKENFPYIDNDVEGEEKREARRAETPGWRDSDEEPWIAHATEGKKSGYVIEPLKDYIKRNVQSGMDRAFQAFRLNSESARESLAREAADEEKHHRLIWSATASARVLSPGNGKLLSPEAKAREQDVCDKSPEKSPRKKTFCSQWAAKCLKTLHPDYHLPIGNNILPMQLENALYNHPQYELCVYPGHAYPSIKIKDKSKKEETIIKADIHCPYEYVQGLIQKEIFRLNTSKIGKQKAAELEKALNENKKKIKAAGYTNSHHAFMAARILFKKMIPLLKKNTGKTIKIATAYKNVKNAAQKIGIFIRDLDTPEINSAMIKIFPPIKEVSPPLFGSPEIPIDLMEWREEEHKELKVPIASSVRSVGTPKSSIHSSTHSIRDIFSGQNQISFVRRVTHKQRSASALFGEPEKKIDLDEKLGESKKLFVSTLSMRDIFSEQDQKSFVRRATYPQRSASALFGEPGESKKLFVLPASEEKVRSRELPLQNKTKETVIIPPIASPTVSHLKNVEGKKLSYKLEVQIKNKIEKLKREIKEASNSFFSFFNYNDRRKAKCFVLEYILLLSDKRMLTLQDVDFIIYTQGADLVYKKTFGTSDVQLLINSIKQEFTPSLLPKEQESRSPNARTLKFNL